VTVRFEQVRAFPAAQARIVGRTCQEQPGALPDLATVPEPDVIDRAERMDGRQRYAKFLSQLAANSLVGVLIMFDPATRWPVKDGSGLRISDFGNEEYIVTPD
jgi:hypothetical protein